ncbi:MAG: SH3 domain-containing protein [Terrisporobacter sp.]|uniref:L,D-transpeptidase family protein n=1 Tax=Terrisporobacter sp. TaxID=1965305 RepID=UPI002FC5B26A
MGIKKRQPIAKQEPQIKYTLANVNLRDNKSTKANIITVIPEGSKVVVIDAEEDWYEVKYDNQQGYVYNEYLSKTMYTWTSVSLRLFPTSESMQENVITAKSRLQVLDVLGDWSKVVYNDEDGYVFNYFLSDDGNPPNAYDFTSFGNDMDKFVNDNNIKSPTVNLIVTDLYNFYTYVYMKDENNNWKRLYKWECTVGKPSTPTIVGTYYISGRKPYFGSDTYRVKYATRIKGSYYYHSILFNANGTEIIDDTLGKALSHGCIRLAVENSQWIYDNVLDTSAVVIH